MVAELQDDGYTVRFCTVEAVARGLIFKSVFDAQKQLGTRTETENKKQGDVRLQRKHRAGSGTL